MIYTGRNKTKSKTGWLIAAALLTVGAGIYLGIRILANLPKLNYNNGAGGQTQIVYPDVRFAVISDSHVYHPSLGTGDDAAFDAVMRSDRKMLLDSQALLGLAIDQIMESRVSFVLVAGDITKDGERLNHELAVEQFRRLTDNGIRVLVVPGNHDINNPDAKQYSGDTATSVPTISAGEFAELYTDFGYGDALFRDETTLSYLAEPVDGLYVLALDGCRYAENQPDRHPYVGARFTQGTVDWIAEMGTLAQERNKALVVLSHHGIVEHWSGQAQLHDEYLTFDHKNLGAMLASYGVRMAFTGHYHAQDIVRGDFKDGSYLYDIETGSLVTAPCPLRYVSIQNAMVTIDTVSLVDKVYPGTDFAQRAVSFAHDTVVLEAIKVLKQYKLPDSDAEYIAGLVGSAFVAHYNGDENPDLRVPADTSRLSLWGRIVMATQGYVLDGLWQDLPPWDNAVIFKLP